MPSNGGRRMSTGAGMQSVGSRLSSQTQSSHYGYGQHAGSGRIMPRSGSDQHLPRVDYTSITTPARHTLLRSSLKSGLSDLSHSESVWQLKIWKPNWPSIYCQKIVQIFQRHFSSCQLHTAHQSVQDSRDSYFTCLCDRNIRVEVQHQIR